MSLASFFGIEREATPSPQPAEPARDRRAALPSLLGEADAWLTARSHLLPLEALLLAWRTVDLTQEVLALATHLDHGTLLLLDRTHQDYLPKLLKAYERAHQSGSASPQALVADLQLITESILQVREAVATENQRSLQAQSRFLDKKFGGSDLE